MAERRMFAKTIIDSDAFLDMPMSARLLYYDLGMRADDDGFVNSPKKIMRMMGATDDDIKLLAAKKFIIPFQSGVVVIKHWKIHNYIQKDRYIETKYKDEKSLLELDENNAYKFPDTNMYTERVQDVKIVDTQVRLGKVSIDKNIYALFSLFWDKYPRKVAKAAAEKAFNKLKPNEELLNTILARLEVLKKSDGWVKDNGQFIPYPATFLNGRRWEDEIESTVLRSIHDV
jgi:hypothetical protein